MGNRIAVGISGGVDSAVSAALLKEQGYEVIGVHLYCWDKGEYCTADKDRASALKVAKHLDIPFIVWDLRKEYEKRVIDYFFDEYRKGRTPNPDVVCNREIKFGIFFERALKELKVSKIATGHYARVEAKSGEQNGKSRNCPPIRYRLLRGVDGGKDQSYFLWVLGQRHLARILFPIGGLLKEEVRAKAREWGLPCADRPDSQGICFIGPVNVAKFLREHLPIKPGPVLNTEGEVIGEHDGVWFYTEGQRRGFRITKPGYPLYVIRKDLERNILVVGRGKESEVSRFTVEGINWIGGSQETGAMRQEIGVRIRHLGEILSGRLGSTGDKPLAVSRKLKAKLAEPAFGVAPGQSAVFYGSTGSPQAEEVLGGGVIGAVV